MSDYLLDIYYRTTLDPEYLLTGRCLCAQIIKNTGSQQALLYQSGIQNVVFGITNNKINTNGSGLLDVNIFLRCISNYYVPSGYGSPQLKLLPGVINANGRQIPAHKYDNSIPLSFKRASSIVNFGIL
jgi:hypothetical protein